MSNIHYDSLNQYRCVFTPMKNFFPYLALFLVSCSGSGGMNSEPDEMNQPSNNDSIIFNCGVTSQNLENCQITQNQNSRELYIFNAMDAESTIDAPVIFSFHGGGGTAIANMEYSGFRQIAESEKFILVYPQGQYFSDKDSTGWIFNENNNITDDLFFISEVIDWLYQNKNINLDRIYATGFSVGAIMSYDLACKLSNKIAAAAPVAGTMSTETFETCRPEKSKSIIHIHGESDSVLSPNGNEYIKSFDESLQFWSDFNQCSTSSTSNISDSNDDGYSGTSIIYENCSNQVLVNGILLENFDHQWPSTNDQKNGSDIDAASYIWSFLKKFDVDGFIE